MFVVIVPPMCSSHQGGHVVSEYLCVVFVKVYIDRSCVVVFKSGIYKCVYCGKVVM